MSVWDAWKKATPAGWAVTAMEGAPEAPDYMAAGQQNMAANRPNQNTPYGSTQWTTSEFTEPPPPNSAGPQAIIAWQKRKEAHNANPANKTQQTGFSGPLAGVNESLMGQLGGLSQPMDWAQFGQLGNGDAARQQAIDASYNQATKRLDPQFKQSESQLRTQLINQGLDPNSQAGRAAAMQLSNQKNDAYGSAMNSAIMSGQSAGDSVFRNNMSQRQQMIAEALGQRGQPMSELQQMQGFLKMPGFNQSNDIMNAAGMQGSADWQRYLLEQQQANDKIQSGMQIAGAI